MYCMVEMWFVYAATATCLVAVADFTISVISRSLRPRLSVRTLNLVVFGFMAIVGGLAASYAGLSSNEEGFTRKAKLGFHEVYAGKARTWVTVPIVGLLYLVGNSYLWAAYQKAHDVGVVEAVYTGVTNIAFMVLTVSLFNSTWTWVNAGGIALSVLGVGLMSVAEHRRLSWRFENKMV